MLDKISEIAEEARQSFAKAVSLEDVEKLRVKFLGRKGPVAAIIAGIPSLSGDLRREVGRKSNELKKQIAALVKETRDRAASAAQTHKPVFDPTLPGRAPVRGAVHPLVQTLGDIKRIFSQLGFTISTGPEVELEYYNFEALNIPPDHPSRDDFDTFYIDGREDVLLRSQTSTVQIRTMEKMKPPLRIIAPGKVFRPDTEDARHSSMFHQVEGLMVDEDVTFGDLKAVLHLFANLYFEQEVKMRFRPSYFPFTEPSAEVDVSCPLCKGSGCTVCGYSGWLEVLGAGMVDPAVFEAVGYDPERYTGFAFGMGVERLTMIKYRIDDIRLFFQGDVRFLAQFS